MSYTIRTAWIRTICCHNFYNLWFSMARHISPQPTTTSFAIGHLPARIGCDFHRLLIVQGMDSFIGKVWRTHCEQQNGSYTLVHTTLFALCHLPSPQGRPDTWSMTNNSIRVYPIGASCLSLLFAGCMHMFLRRLWLLACSSSHGWVPHYPRFCSV